ncbi:hypothetical protein AMTRI_Chr02g221530 [Amborella trichopoda]|uniref:Kinesin motor domain-containing protein n=1 Tax=Amborella trichopoda TaxID=13333 RepID=U5D8U1_AMBTC|nr:hypothetical protein AMTR_s00057p00096030 [Amborella trichopoda]
MAQEGLSSMEMALDSNPFMVSCTSVMEDVIQQTRLSDVNLASRKAEEAASRRYEAAGWLKKIVGVVGSRDLPNDPSEEEFLHGLRNGLILCNAINKVQPGAVPKVVENPTAAVPPPDGAALLAYQYFENVRNFLVAVQEMRLPTFEASDLEMGGNCAKVVNCVLGLKSYSDWKQTGGNGMWRYGANSKPPTNSGKCVVNVKPSKNSDPFMNSLSKNLYQTDPSGPQQMDDKGQNGFSLSRQNSSANLSLDSTEVTPGSHSLNTLVRAALSDRKPEEVPCLVESMLSKVMEEFERRLATQSDQLKTVLKDLVASGDKKSLPKAKVLAALAAASRDLNMEINEEDGTCLYVSSTPPAYKEEMDHRALRQKTLFDQQQREIKELKHILQTTKAGIHFMQMKYSEDFYILERHLCGLSRAASGYNKVLEENRHLYNQVQDLKGSIRVYCRVRPFLPGQASRSSTVDYIGDGNLTILNPLKQGKDARRSFNFNKVFGPSTTQAEVFADTQPLIRSVLDGYNVCIFAYGQTGSGKTYTMNGPKEITEQSRGVNYRALSDLFCISEQRRDTFSYEVSVQMIEIYNEQVRDLLAADEIRNNSQQKGLNVPEANLVLVTSTSEVVELMNIGHRNRAVGATALNDRSSRSHSCLTVHVQGRDMTSGAVLRGCLHLVDLAGSERVDKSEATGERLKEAQHINKSLSALGDVIASLAQKNAHVPYRNSKLTQLLQDSLGGQAKTLMFVHISPDVEAFGETTSTLKFAERVASVELGAARVNKESVDVRELKEQVASLKAALTKKEGEQEQVRSARLSPERQRIKGSGPSPMHSSRQNGDVQGVVSNHRLPMEEVGNIEVRSNITARPKIPSFDPPDFLTQLNSPPWPDSGLKNELQKREEREMGSPDWVDKVMVNKQETGWEGESPMPDIFYQKYIADMRKIYPDQQYTCQPDDISRLRSRKASQDFEDNMLRSSSYEMATTDDSDEIEIETSDSSEADLLWQFNLPNNVTTGNATSVMNVLGSKIKKPQQRLVKSPNKRNPNQAHGPSPSRKLSNGGPARTGRQPVSGGADGKRPSSGGKFGVNGK